jgi:dUTPase
MEVVAVQGGYVAKWCPRHLAALSSHLSAVRLPGLWNDDYRGESSPNSLISAIFRLVTYHNSNRLYDHFVSLVVILCYFGGEPKWLFYSLVDMA